jgi:hypothetical protein
MGYDFALRLVGGCLPDFAAWSGYPPIAVLSINRGIDVMGQKPKTTPASDAPSPRCGLRSGSRPTFCEAHDGESFRPERRRTSRDGCTSGAVSKLLRMEDGATGARALTRSRVRGGGSLAREFRPEEIHDAGRRVDAVAAEVESDIELDLAIGVRAHQGVE